MDDASVTKTDDGFKKRAQPPSSDNDDSLQTILDKDAKVEKLAGNFQFTEGPLWNPSGFLLFSDIPADTIYKITPDGKVEKFRSPAGHPNGNTLDRQGRLVTAEHDRRLTRTEKNGAIAILASQYEGKKLNSPNDVVVKSDGSIYFTDPPYGINKEQEELGFYGVYRITTDGKLTLLVKNMVRPNGLAFSPDEKKLYVSDSQEGNIRVFEVNSDGTLANQQLFADLKVPDKDPLADGMKVDSRGNVYATGQEGIWIFSPEGKQLGKIALPETPTNVAWGESDYKTLFMTAGRSIYRIRLKIPGIQLGV
jgi:gluconolactonase